MNKNKTIIKKIFFFKFNNRFIMILRKIRKVGKFVVENYVLELHMVYEFQ